MLKITFHISSKHDNDALASATDDDFRYALFTGDVVLESDDTKIELCWGWIPLLDFAYSLMYISNSLRTKKNALEPFEFTESDAILLFQKEKNVLTISTSFSSDKIQIDFSAFSCSIETFHSELITKLSLEYPSLLFNSSFKRLGLYISP